jgi:uncharacterized membrane protein YebE (DUF533 family)
MKQAAAIAAIFLFAFTAASAQDFKKQQQAQEHAIKAAQRKHRITDREYEKLMKEQYIIQETIERAAEDGLWTAREKNAVAGKLERAGRRLQRYKTNREIY